MKKKIIRALPFKRKNKGITNYKKRIALIRGEKHRLVVRKSLKGMQAAIVEFNEKGDKVIASANSKALAKFGWKADNGNIPSAYLTGFLLGKKAKGKNVNEAVLDIGLSSSIKGSRIYAVVAGIVDSGIKVPHGEDILPPKERLNGTHISKYAEMLKNDQSKYQRQFGNYLKNNVDPLHLPKHFEEIKNKLKG